MTQPADLTRLMDNARMNLPGALDPAIKLELFNTLDEFLRESKVWLEDVTVEVSSARTDYEILSQDPGTIISLMSLADENDVRVGATMEVPGTIILTREQTETRDLVAKVALNVVDPVDNDDYPQIPEWLLAKYHYAILAGLLAKMMAQMAKPYSNERMAIFNLRKFRAAISVARAEASHQGLYGGQRWRFPNFAQR